MRLLGAVLAGGRSSRFGSDKAEARLAGKKLLDHAVAALAAMTEMVVICGRQVPGHVCLEDRPRTGLGPLGGINAGLFYARSHGFDGVVTTGCDMPVFPLEIFNELTSAGAAVVHRQHLAAFWPVALSEALDEHISGTSDLSLFAWIDVVTPRFITMPDIVMPNINHVEDLASFDTQVKKDDI